MRCVLETLNYLLIMPKEGLDVIHPLIEGLSVVLGHVKLHLVAVPVVDEEPRQVLGVKLHVNWGEVNRDAADCLSAVPGHEDFLILGVGEHVVTVVIRMMKKLVNGRLLGIRSLFVSDEEL